MDEMSPEEAEAMILARAAELGDQFRGLGRALTGALAASVDKADHDRDPEGWRELYDLRGEDEKD